MIRLVFIKISLLIISHAISLAFSFNPAHAAELVVKKSGAKLLAAKEKGAQVLATLEQGEVLTSVSRHGMLWKVEWKDGSHGFIPVFHVSRRATEAGGLSAAIREASVNERSEDQVKGSRTRTAVMGVRGLRADDEISFIGNVKPDFDLVYRMEDIKIPDDRINDLEARLNHEIKMRHESVESKDQ